MKKKVLAIALAVALIAVAVSGSIAYFTAEDQVNNTFTIGSVKIEVYENDQKTPSDTNPLGKLTPVVDANPKNDVSYMDKVVEVKNIGANDAYIRTHIAVPTALLNYLTLDFTNPLAGWTFIGETTATVDVDYTVYTYTLTPNVPEDFPYEAVGIPRDYPWARGRVEVPIWHWQGRVIWGLTARIVQDICKHL